MSEELKRLMMKLKVAKEASVFNKPEAINSALDDLLRLLMKHEAQIMKLEKLGGV